MAAQRESPCRPAKRGIFTTEEKHTKAQRHEGTELCFASGRPGGKPSEQPCFRAFGGKSAGGCPKKESPCRPIKREIPTTEEKHTKAQRHKGTELCIASGRPGRKPSEQPCFRAFGGKPAAGCPARKPLPACKAENFHHGGEAHKGTELCFASGCPGSKPSEQPCFRAFGGKPAAGCPARKPLPASKAGGFSPQKARRFALRAAVRGVSSASNPVSGLSEESRRATAQRESPCRPAKRRFFTTEEKHTKTRRHGALHCERPSGEKAQRAKHCFRAFGGKPQATTQREPPAGQQSGDFSPRKRSTQRHKDTKARSFALRAAVRGESRASKTLFPGFRRKAVGRLPSEKPPAGQQTGNFHHGREAHKDTKARRHGALHCERPSGEKAERAKHCFRAFGGKPAGDCPARKPLPACKRGFFTAEGTELCIASGRPGRKPSEQPCFQAFGGKPSGNCPARNYVSGLASESQRTKASERNTVSGLSEKSRGRMPWG